jgi:hypothetical protein
MLWYHASTLELLHMGQRMVDSISFLYGSHDVAIEAPASLLSRIVGHLPEPDWCLCSAGGTAKHMTCLDCT